MALISKLANAYAQLTQPAAQRFSAGMDNPRGRSLNMAAPFRKSAAVMDLGAQPGSEDLTPQAMEEQRKKKQLLDAQRSGIMSAAWLSLSGNQF